MKKLFLKSLLPVLCCLFSVAFPQGNLQFNQVILLDIPSLGTPSVNVPAGKVWKIESTGTGFSSSGGFYLRNSSGVNIGYLSTQNNSGASAFPVWLPSGFAGSIQNTTSYRGYISIIEFNVVP